MTLLTFPDSLSRVICIASGKGGVFKSTITANAAALAAAAGHRVLVVDLDPQGDISDDLGYFADDRRDDGHHLATSIINGTPLQPVLTEVRPRLDVIPGGDYLKDVRRHLARQDTPAYDSLAQALAPLAEEYDLIFLDTPPNDEDLQILAMAASRWVLVSTRPDPSSIRAIASVRQAQLEALHTNPTLEMIGVVLVGLPTKATQVTAKAKAGILAVLGGTAPLFDQVVRDSTAAAWATRERGIVAHELAEEVEGAEPFWKALREGKTAPPRLPGTAPALADDYVKVADQLLRRISEREDTAEELLEATV